MSEFQTKTQEPNGPAKSGKPDRFTVAKRWWESLQPSKSGDGSAGGGNRAALARLRRCSTWFEAAAEPETAHLFRRIGQHDERRLPRIAVLAVVLAHVRTEEPSKLASSVGPENGTEENAKLKPLRLRRLLSATADDEILTAFRRLVALKGGTANVADLTRNILNWHDEKTRMRFAFDYWQAGAAAPMDEAPDELTAAANA